MARKKCSPDVLIPERRSTGTFTTLRHPQCGGRVVQTSALGGCAFFGHALRTVKDYGETVRVYRHESGEARSG